MIGSGNFPPGRALRPEVRMNKEQGEAVIQYYDVDGKPCSLDTLCRKDPAWAANRIRVMTEQLASSEAATGGKWEVASYDNLPDSDAQVVLVDAKVGWSSIAFGLLEISDDSEGQGEPYWESTRGQQRLTEFTHWCYLRPLPSKERRMTQEEAVMKRLTAEELAEWKRMLDNGLDSGQLECLVEVTPALLAMASQLVELESHDAPLDVPFGCDPEDSAALEKLRIAIDDADVWPSEGAKEAGDYEAAVAHMADRASRLVELESALDYLHRECPMSTSDYEPGALLLLAKQLGWTSPTQKPNDGGRDG